MLAISTGDLNESARAAHPDWAKGIRESQIADLEYVQDGNMYLAHVVAPVVTPTTGERIGYIAEIFDITPLLKFGLGYDPYRNSGPSSDDLYQLVLRSASGVMTAWRLDGLAEPGNPKLVSEPLDKQFGKLMLDPALGQTGFVVSRIVAGAPTR